MPRVLQFRAVTALLLSLTLAACGRATNVNTTNIAGIMPALEFSLVRTNDNVPVTARLYRGDVILLYFGYTHCPDECPLTLANLARTLKSLGQSAAKTRVLFVTVDPDRDTISVLKSYVHAFGPNIDGLRGDPNSTANLARRYRVLYSVTLPSPGHPYSVMHSDALFIFDETGRARFVTTSTTNTDALVGRIRELQVQSKSRA